jgi:hypothetical protein
MEDNKINHEDGCSHEIVRKAIFIKTSNSWSDQKIITLLEWSKTNEKLVIDLLHDAHVIDFEGRRILPNPEGYSSIYADFEELATLFIALGYIRLHESMDEFEILKKTSKYSGEQGLPLHS